MAGWRSLFSLVLGMVIAASGAAFAADTPNATPQAENQVRLVVLVVFDQLRGDYLQRWGQLFGEGGFRRLEQEGAWFQDCHYPYAVTKTAAGHASLLTGCSPDKHGVITNEWFDRRAGKYAYCVGSERHELVPPLREKQSDEKRLDDAPGIAPERLLVPTVGDVLKKASAGRARVVSLSFKDRSAVLPGGRQPDACYWFNTSTGQFITSTYYRDSLHAWAADFNRARSADRWQGKEWNPLYPKLNYHALCGTKMVREQEDADKNFSRRLPAGGEGNLSGAYYKSLYVTPFGNEVILDLAKLAIDREELGRHRHPDLLSISFSCNDPIGHVWGPDSQEVLDVTLRSDKVVKELLDHLDARVGKGRYVLALTADHGICPLPEESRARGAQATRVPSTLLSSDAEDFLRATFGKENDKGRWLEARAEPWVYLNQSLLKQRGLDAAEVEATLARWYRTQPGILTAYTRSQLLKGVPADDPVGQSVLRSFHPERAGDVAVILKPLHLFGSVLSIGTTHGTPHPYDTHVPLLVLGPGIRAGAYKDRVTPQAITPIFARALGIEPPSGNETKYPESLKD